MRVLVTGSSGWLGRTLVPRLRRGGHDVVGLDPVPAATTQIVGSVAERALVCAAIRDFGVTAIVHAGAPSSRENRRASTRPPTPIMVTISARIIDAAIASCGFCASSHKLYE